MDIDIALVYKVCYSHDTTITENIYLAMLNDPDHLFKGRFIDHIDDELREVM